MTRELRRDIYQLSHEIMDSATGGRAQPVGESFVQSSKGCGISAWTEWAIDVSACRGDDAEILDRVYMRGVLDTRERRTRAEMTAIRRFWKEMRKRKLDLYGERILEILAA